MQFFKTYPLLFAFLGGVCAFVALVFPTLWFIGILAVAGYFGSTAHAPSWKHTIVYGLLFGILASMGGIWWFWDTVPLSWIAIPEGPIQFLLVGVVFALSVISLALPFAVAAPLIKAIPDGWYRPLALVCVYIALEEIRMWSFALFFLAPESALAPDFSVAGLGYLLTESPLLLPIAQAGHYGLNGFLALLSAVLLVRKKTHFLLGIALIIVFLLMAQSSLPKQQPEGQTTRIALLATDAPPGPFKTPYIVTEAMKKAGKEGAKIIATPEGLGLAPFLDHNTRQTLYRQIFNDTDGLIISSSVVHEENGNEHAELLYESSTEGVIASQDKIFFVPIGEYLPPIIRIAVSFAGKENLHGYGSYIAGRAVAGKTMAPAQYNGLRVGALLCSEILSPRLYNRLAQTDTDILFNLANNSWFHESRLLHARLQQLAKTHAVKNRQYFLVSANGSPAYAVNTRGKIIGSTKWGEPDVLIVDVPLNLQQ